MTSANCASTAASIASVFASRLVVADLPDLLDGLAAPIEGERERQDVAAGWQASPGPRNRQALIEQRLDSHGAQEFGVQGQSTPGSELLVGPLQLERQDGLSHHVFTPSVGGLVSPDW
jgi:hypothetical protein